MNIRITVPVPGDTLSIVKDVLKKYKADTTNVPIEVLSASFERYALTKTADGYRLTVNYKL